MSGHMTSRRGTERRAVERPLRGGGLVVATRSHTLTGSVCSRAKQAICGRISPRLKIHSKAYCITTPFWAESGRGWGGCFCCPATPAGGRVVFAVQPHREVRPGSWLVKAYRITTPFWAESGKEGEEGTWRLLHIVRWGVVVVVATRSHTLTDG